MQFRRVFRLGLFFCSCAALAQQGAVEQMAVPHVVDGGGWQTTIRLTNLAPRDTHFVVMFEGVYQRPGGPGISIANRGTVTRVWGTLRANQSAEIETEGRNEKLVQGRALVRTLKTPFLNDASSEPIPSQLGGTVAYRYRGDGRSDRETIVPLQPASGVPATLFFDNRSGNSTGVAVAYTGPYDSSFELTARDLQGEILERSSAEVDGYFDRYLFSSTQGNSLQGKRGVLQLKAPTGEPAAASVVGLHFSPDGAFTQAIPLRRPVLSDTRSPLSARRIVDGAGWTTTLLLTNFAPTTTHALIRFSEDPQKPSPRGFRFNVEGQIAELALSIPAYASVELETAGLSPDLIEGRATISRLITPYSPPASPTLSADQLGGCLIYRQRIEGGERVASAPLTEDRAPEAYQSLFFDARDGAATALALRASQKMSDATGTELVARDMDGTELLRTTLTLWDGKPPISFSVAEKFPELAGKQGILQLKDAVDPVAFQFHQGGAFSHVPLFPPVK